MYPFGVELTFIRAKGKLIENLSWAENVYIPPKFSSNKCDGNHIEIRTPILKTIEGLKRFYKALDPYIEKYQLETHFSETIKNTEYIHDTGGGHVHIGIPKNVWSSNLVSGLTDILEKTYYLRWFFGSFSESDLNFFNGGKKIELLFSKCPSSIIILSRFNTLEHRYFDAPKDLQQCIEHVEFAQAFSRAIFEKDNGLFYWWDYKNRDNIDYTINSFKTLIFNLGLNFDNYSKYVDNYIEFAKYRKLK